MCRHCTPQICGGKCLDSTLGFLLHSYFSVLKKVSSVIGVMLPPFPLGYTSDFTYVSFFELIVQFILLQNVSNIMLLLL